LTNALLSDIYHPGPGTGIAPMRALLQERKFRCDAEKLTSKNTLYFGCKKRDVDYLYKDEIEDYVNNKTLSSLHLAFSREQKQKVSLPLNLLFQPIHSLL
jgi:NADPH-ferrihemoprotein reductase